MAGREPAPESADEHTAREIVLRRLTDSPRSRAELAESLAKRHIPEDVATTVLDRFEEVGLVDDVEFAHQWVQSRQRAKGIAHRVLALELRRKGIDDDVARSALGEVDPEAERQAAHMLVQRKLRAMDGLDTTTQVRRLTGLLARKGYAPQVAFEVVRTEVADSQRFLEGA
jgi:regulatory protein